MQIECCRGKIRLKNILLKICIIKFCKINSSSAKTSQHKGTNSKLGCSIFNKFLILTVRYWNNQRLTQVFNIFLFHEYTRNPSIFIGICAHNSYTVIISRYALLWSSRTWFSEGIHFIVFYGDYGAAWSLVVLSSGFLPHFIDHYLVSLFPISLSSNANYIHTPG